VGSIDAVCERFAKKDLKIFQNILNQQSGIIKDRERRTIFRQRGNVFMMTVFGRRFLINDTEGHLGVYMGEARTGSVKRILSSCGSRAHGFSVFGRFL
jgi:hypothetical protein